ncbi:Uncharacterised protein [Mycobacteroides abscessus subsp. abscessus]|nr:Uncharacterised protein [Mycobacteroides abscessus subsp. abscessus]
MVRRSERVLNLSASKKPVRVDEPDQTPTCYENLAPKPQCHTLTAAAPATAPLPSPALSPKYGAVQ